MTSGFRAAGPMTVRVVTASSSLSGMRASWLPITRMSSHDTTGLRVRMGSVTDRPSMDMLWIAAKSRSSSSFERRHSSR